MVTDQAPEEFKAAVLDPTRLKRIAELETPDCFTMTRRAAAVLAAAYLELAPKVSVVTGGRDDADLRDALVQEIKDAFAPHWAPKVAADDDITIERENVAIDVALNSIVSAAITECVGARIWKLLKPNMHIGSQGGLSLDRNSLAIAVPASDDDTYLEGDSMERAILHHIAAGHDEILF